VSCRARLWATRSAGRLVAESLMIAVVCAVFFATSAFAAYPDRPIHLIVPFSPGGGVDVVSRLLAQRLSEKLGQPVVVENHPGGGANIGNEYVAQAAPDGYTLLMASPGTAINASLYRKLSYSLERDFVPVASVISSELLLVVAANSPIRDVQDLIARARANPGQVVFASAGVGSTEHLAGELLAEMAGVKLLHVPYKGTGLAINDLLGGQVQFLFGGAAGLVPLVQAGQLRALAQTGLHRQPDLANIPTMDEAGVKGYDVVIWNGVLAPKGTPGEVVKTLNIVISAAADNLAPQFSHLGAYPATMSPEEFGAMIRAQVSKWAGVIHTANVPVK
jgi:tripartite-type tricarboxylate transporter receptor subunit TctC